MRIQLSFIVFTLTFLILVTGCNDDSEHAIAVIPLPNEYSLESGNDFVFTDTIKIAISDSNDEKLQDLKKLFVDIVNRNLSITLNQVNVDQLSTDKYVLFDLALQSDSTEAYQLVVTEQYIKLSARDYHGLFNGIQTLRQLMFHGTSNQSLPLVTIIDQPQFTHRGLMLDVSRHFFTIAEIKKTLDFMSLYKLNTFHWHLTDDQGWRIEIEKYPLLTEIGSYRSETMVEKNFDPYIGDGIAHSGFYSKEDIVEVVAYAKARYITIIPEIDMPGHMSAAIAAYPELGCRSKQIEVPTRWGIFNNVLCPKELTFRFLEDVLQEVMTLFPSDKIHLGGDEVPPWAWQQSEQAQNFIASSGLEGESALHHYFFQRMADYLKQYGRAAIGWDDILAEGELENTSVMAWQDLNQATLAAKAGLEVILSPSEFTYLNYYQGIKSEEPLAQCCSLPIEKVYQFNPILSGLSVEQHANVVGVQANLWTEYITTQAHLEYMLMPRLMAIAELAWTEQSNMSWQDFEKNYKANFAFLDSLGVGYREKK